MRHFPPRRLICLTEETVETLYLLGEQDRTVGALIGEGDKAAALARTPEERVATVARETRTTPRRPRVYFEEWNDPMISAIGWVSELIEVAGGADVFSSLRAAPDRGAAGLGRRAGRRPQSHRRDQICSRPAARPRRVDRWARCDQGGDQSGSKVSFFDTGMRMSRAFDYLPHH
jgi:hypothetical protein